MKTDLSIFFLWLADSDEAPRQTRLSKDKSVRLPTSFTRHNLDSPIRNYQASSVQLVDARPRLLE